MSIDTESLKSQLAPGWSPVNIGLMVIGLWIFWPLGLAMLGYILKGADVGVDLRRPGSFLPFFRNLGDSARAAFDKFKNNGSADQPRSAGGIPQRDSNDQWQRAEREKLQSERADLERERAAFEAEKRAFESRTDA